MLKCFHDGGPVGHGDYRVGEIPPEERAPFPDAIAARLSPPLETIDGHPIELVVVGSGVAALRAGFMPNRVHDSYPWMRVWWPGLGDRRLHGWRPQRITISADARLSSINYEILRQIQKCHGDNAIWIEL